MKQQSDNIYRKLFGTNRIGNPNINVSKAARIIKHKQEFEGTGSALQYAQDITAIKEKMLITSVGKEKETTGRLKEQFAGEIKMLDRELELLQFAKSKLESILEEEKGRESYEK